MTRRNRAVHCVLLMIASASLLPSSAARAAGGDVKELRKRLDEVEDRLDKVEKKTLLDRIALSAEYRTVVNAFHYRGPSPNAWDLVDPSNPLVRNTIKSTTEEVWSHRLRLKMKAEPISSLRLTARLVFYKHFGDGDSPPFIQDFAAARTPRDSAVRFDQLWIDWFIVKWLAISVGRIAYAEGNPNELRLNSTIRRATWGLHMVDGEYETANLTVNLSSLIEGFYIRGFYASWFNDNDDDPFGGFPFLTNGTNNLRIFGGNIDFTIPKIGKNFIQIGYYIVPRFRPFVIPIPDPGFNPADDYTHAPAPLNNSQLFPSEMPDSLGTYQNVSALIEFYNLAGSGIDLFVAGAIGLLKPNGKGISYELPLPGAATPAQRQSTPFLFLASQGDSGTTYFLYAGARYTIPLSFKPKIGFEFNYGSRYHISFAMPNDQLLAKLATRGKAFETYLIVPINKYIYLRATHLYIDNDYQTGFFGPNPAFAGTTAPTFDQRIHNFQLVLDVSI
ncbi:MAG: DUF3373 family protein [Myxococcales bacterium]|nr:DUF3373 family protein [Myxococcales bacterium]